MSRICTTSTLASMVPSKKGSIANKIERGVEQGKNNVKTHLKSKAVVGLGVTATGAATVAVSKSKTLQNVITKGFETLKNSNFGKQIGEVALSAAPYVQKGLGFVKALPGPAKAVLAAGTVLTASAAGTILKNHAEKTGEINQKYKNEA